MHTASIYASGNCSEIMPDDYYGRQTLQKMDNGDNYVYVYDCIAKGVANHEEKIKVYDEKHSILSSEIELVYETYCNDYPQHFWRSNFAKYEHIADKVLFLYPEYSFSKEEYLSEKLRFEKEADRIISEIDTSMSEFDRELELHDRLAQMVSYHLDATHVHDSYGAIIDGRAVCEGYARAFQYLLYKVGIQAITVSGEANGAHAWNLVRIDGEYYYTDLTWDDHGEYIYHAYFNQTLQDMQIDHKVDSKISLPQCTSLKANYYYASGATRQYYSVDMISKLLKNNPMVELYFTCDTVNLKWWYNSHINDIVKAAEITGEISYNCIQLGNKLIFILEGSRNTPERLSDDIVGDINRDGEITIKDLSMLKRYLAGWNVSINESVADVNGDGTINVKDNAAIKRYLAGWNSIFKQWS